jgi:hypothetical protein
MAYPHSSLNLDTGRRTTLTTPSLKTATNAETSEANQPPTQPPSSGTHPSRHNPKAPSALERPGLGVRGASFEASPCYPVQPYTFGDDCGHEMKLP